MTRLHVIAALAMMSSLMLLVGCSNKVTAEKVRSKLTPELYSTAHSRGQFQNRTAISIDHTSRQASDDFAKLILMDKPLRLTKWPVP